MLVTPVPVDGLQMCCESACLSHVACGRHVAGGRDWHWSGCRLSVVEQRYRAVLDAVAGVPVTEVADRYGVSRQSVHAWIRRYEDSGLGGLMDRSRRPESCPHQASAEVEAGVRAAP
jgi:hypothetical protein